MKDFLERVLTPEQRAEWGRMLAAQRKPRAIACATCGREVVGTDRRRYCSDYCRVKAQRQRRRAQQAEP